MANQIDSLGCSHASLTMAYHNKLLWGRVFQAWSPSFLSLSLPHCLCFSPSLTSVSLPFSLSCSSFLLSFPSHLSVSLILPLPSLSPFWQAVVWLHLIAVEINKAGKFVFLLYCVTQRKRRCFQGGIVIWAGCALAESHSISLFLKLVNQVYHSVLDVFCTVMILTLSSTN